MLILLDVRYLVILSYLLLHFLDKLDTLMLTSLLGSLGSNLFELW
ncbi:hypothetical protein NUACC26_031750 [Scytonema sp. NUACC26]